MEWQPIETLTPLEVPDYLLSDGVYVIRGRWSDLYQAYTHIGGLLFVSEPTHWMPLPEPPKGGE